MTIRLICKGMLVSAGAIALASCGGGGLSTGFIPAPPVSPTPTPTPTPTPAPLAATVTIFPEIKSSTSFATIGLELSEASPPALISTGFSVAYDAASGLYVMDVPATSPTPFYQWTNNTPNATWWNGALIEPGGNSPANVKVLKPDNPELKLSYTTLAGYDTFGIGGGTIGWLAFGTATSAGAVPTVGTASYAALVRGSDISNSGMIQGTASLLFDFSAGKLAGHFDPVFLSYGGLGETQSLGRYDFASTVYSSGSATFSGQLSSSNFGQNGTFSGQFTGPNAQELMATWAAPFHDPIKNIDSAMFGVWVGAK